VHDKARALAKRLGVKHVAPIAPGRTAARPRFRFGGGATGLYDRAAQPGCTADFTDPAGFTDPDRL